MIFNKIIFKISVAWVVILPTWATVSVSNAASVAENRLAAELIVMKGDLRRMDEFSDLSFIKKGLKDRLLGASAPLSLLIREARDNNSSLPFPPKNSVINLQQALLDEKFKVAKFWIDELVRLFPLKAKGILPPNKTQESLRKTEVLHQEFCSSCHASDADVPYDENIERPAWNLFQMAQEIEKKEFTARLMIGVKGDALTAIENPLTYTEISSLVGFYRNRNTTKGNTPE